jgi:hypothetical protein
LVPSVARRLMLDAKSVTTQWLTHGYFVANHA